ncbi:hypothetical protein [Geobacter sp. AOG1]|uniref:hypothetical protein n=1 Tax=Geobacter sp. AOG1 TaxID=1566346 RepID=UPI001CC3C871|nr:hypothetical protein [Geobacter sp. AOG1]
MEKEKSHICTECFFTGTPKVSVGRLLTEFFTNLIFYTNVPFFQKVRHCPECGGHSMVSIETEAGRIALEKNKGRGRELPRPSDREFLRM